MGFAIDSARAAWPVTDSVGLPKQELTREEVLAKLLWKQYGMDSYRHAAHMCAKEAYKKIGYSCAKVVEALEVLAAEKNK